MKTERVLKVQVEALKLLIGIGAAIIDWDNIDYDIGRGILEGDDRCLWTKDGDRITIEITRDGGLLVSRANGPDPVYFDLKLKAMGDETFTAAEILKALGDEMDGAVEALKDLVSLIQDMTMNPDAGAVTQSEIGARLDRASAVIDRDRFWPSS